MDDNRFERQTDSMNRYREMLARLKLLAIVAGVFALFHLGDWLWRL